MILLRTRFQPHRCSRHLATAIITCHARPRTTSSRHPPPPPEIEEWFRQITTQPAQVSSEVIDPLRSRQLQATLPTRVSLPDTVGGLELQAAGVAEPLPKGHHLAYFQPEGLLSALAEDGSSTEYNAPAPYLRRMWAGGSFQFNPDPARALRIGDTCVQQVSVQSIEFKKDMVFVHQRRNLYKAPADRIEPGLEDWAVREVRSHVFRRNEGVGVNAAIRDKAKVQLPRAAQLPNPSDSDTPYTFTYTPSPPLLFRFSALTFNGHRIHYDRDWTRDVEGHPDLVVHGPLTALMLLELAEHVAGKEGRRLVRFEYRATSPMYVGLPIRLTGGSVQVTDGEGQGKEGSAAEMRAEQDGKVGMRAVCTYV